MSTIDVSIVLTTWATNEYRMKLLRETVESLRANTTVPYQLVVVDNGDEKQTEYVKSICPDVHIINEVNQGPGVGRNQGAAATDTPYLVFVDNDVCFCPGWLEASLEVFRKFPDRKIIVQPGKSRTMSHKYSWTGELLPGYLTYTMAGAWLWVLKRETFVDVGPFISNELDPVEDRNWCI